MNPGKKDIENRNDVQLLIDSFYGKVRTDDTIGYIFNDVAKVDWEHHLPIMYDFWESVLFHKAEYKGNPMEVHRLLSQLTPLKPEHFERWKKLFIETIGEHFEGEKAEMARQRAVSIATMIQLKISQ
ncbi:MAG TPA: group III truncated hemoglobin [Puia sp.]|nr:group III truncated hemoglobin [Puia sp.]